MRLRVFLLAALTALLAAAAPARAAVYTVTDTQDPGACSGFSCTGLQAALDAAKATKGADVVDLKKATYTASKGLTMSDSQGVTVVGLNARGTILNGNTGVRTLSNSGIATLEHLKVTGGNIVDTDGGGIFNSGTLTLDHVEVSGNQAANGGNGGGIASTGTLTILNSLIASNTAAGDGGGLFLSGVVGGGATTLMMRDSTVAFNTAQIRSGGGGIDMRGNPSNAATLQRVTVADNTGGNPDLGTGGILVAGDGEVLAASATIVSGNKNLTGAASNCAGQPRDDGFNLESGSDCAFKLATDKQNANPGFASGLVDGGGETDVLPIPSTSPAVDLGPACSGVADQRDVLRPQGKACDAGAYEFDQAPDIFLDSGPSGLTQNRTPQFTFHSDEPGVSFMCKLDGSPANTFTSCSSPAAYTLTDGPYTFSVEAIDGTHPSPPVASTTFTVDATAPAAPSFTAPANNAFLNTHSVTLQGTAEANASVRIQEGQVVDTTVTASGTGAWSAPLTVAEGTHNYTAFATDAAGNVSPASATRTITVDTAAPAAPTITTPSADILQASATINLSGGAEPGATVKVLEGSTVRATTTASGQGLWSASFTAADGAHPYTATATDAAGNVSTASGTRTITVDTTPPAAPVFTSPADNSLQNTATVTLSGTAEAGATVEIFEATTSRGTTVATGGTWSKTLSGVTDGTHTYTAKATDAAGNVSPASASRTVKVDTTAPAKPAITAPADNALLGTSSPTLSGTAEAGATVEIFEGTTSRGTTVATGGTWSKTLAGVTDGTHTYTAKATDAAGNTSVASDAKTLRVDTTAPAAPAITAPANGQQQNSRTVNLAGTGEAGATIAVLDGGAPAGSVTVAGDGTWTAQLTNVTEGSHTYTATATDPAGNASGASNARTVVVDLTAPAAPAITSPANNSLQNSATVTLSGTAETGATVEVFEGATSRGTTTATGGTWSKTLTAADGAHTYIAKATDAAGNTSPGSASRTVTVDTHAPAAPVFTSPADNSLQNNATVTLTGTAEAGATVEVFEGATSRGTTTATGGTWSKTLTAADGRHVYTAKATDAAGNVSAVSATRTVDVDTGPPAPPEIAAGPALQNTATVALAGTAESGATVEVFEGAASRGTTTATAGSGAWALTLQGVTDGLHTYTARATDIAHNVSDASAAWTVTIDTTPPPADVTGGPSGVTSDAAPAFTFASPDSGATFDCRLDGPAGPGAEAPCTSPHSFGTLAPGSYTFVVRAVDTAGNSTTSSRSFTVAAPQQATPTPTPTPTPSPTPQANQSVVVQPAGGTVLVRLKGTNTFVALDTTKGIPLGSEVDTRHGKVELSSVPKPGAKPQTSLFYGGLFVVTQSKGITQLALSEPLAACPRGKAASAAAKKKKAKTRNLWGDGHGAFRTKGQYSAATVRGTKWNVQDSCAGTLTRVARGVIAVDDFVKHKTKVLRAGQRYLAKPKRR